MNDHSHEHTTGVNCCANIVIFGFIVALVLLAPIIFGVLRGN